jgi:hypothetical protein
MDWATVRAKSRDIVHNMFRYPAIYTAPDGVTTVNVRVRLHNKLEVFGDLDREGYAKRFEEVNQAIFDSTEVVPKKNGMLDFGVTALFAPILGSDRKYQIVNVTPAEGDRYIRTEVTQL